MEFRPSDDIVNPFITNTLNNLYKQVNKQSKHQKQQCSQLTKILKDSIIAKNNTEQERVNMSNKCVDMIEKKF